MTNIIVSIFGDIRKCMILELCDSTLETLCIAVQLPVGYANIKLYPKSEWSPKARVTVYYMRDDGEIIAAATDLNMKRCFKNTVSIQ